MSPKIKLFNNNEKSKNKGLCRTATYPENFEKLIQLAKEFVPSTDNTKRYQLIELKANREITTQEDFELMTNEYQDEKAVKILVNLVDNNIKYLIPNNNIFLSKNEDTHVITNESIIRIDGNNKKEKKDENESNSMNEIIKKKLKELEDRLVDELYNNSMMELEKSKIINKSKTLKNKVSNNNYTHKGIICNKCGKEIIGERFKCVQCSNFNLCEICEQNYNHDMRHIMVSVTYPITDENEFRMKLDKNMSYKNQNMNYALEPNIFYLDRNEDIQSQEIIIKNTGIETWNNANLKCIENKSEIIGQDCEINETINPGNEFKTNIKFFNIKVQLEERKNIYYSLFEMFNEKNQSFGNVTKIKIIIKN